MFELLFKYPPALFERGDVVVSPLPELLDHPAMLAFALLLLAATLVLPSRIRRLGWPRRLLLGALQVLFAAGVLLLLARPAVEVATMAPGANTVAVLVDTSESMGFPAAGDGPSRLQSAAQVAAALIPSLQPVTDVATFSFGTEAERRELTGLAPEAPRTHLLEALDDVLASFRGAPLAAVVVLTDGADNGSAEADAAVLGAAGVPIHTIGFGPLALPGEVELIAVNLPADAPPASRMVAEVTLRHSAAGPAAVKVFDGGRLIAMREVELSGGGHAEQVPVAFDSGPGGIRELEFVVDPPPGDRLAGNNRLSRLLTVSERQRRVLYLEGDPRWEYKFIRRAVAGDEVVALTSWLRTTEHKTYRQGNPGHDELEGGVPATREALYRYDVLVLGSLGATYLNEEQHQWLEAFVADRGGSVLVLGGPESLADGGWDVRPLAEALPVRLSRGSGPGYGPVEGRVRPTPLGVGSPMIQLMDGEGPDPWSTLPTLGDHHRLGPLKPAASVLLEIVVDGEPRPLLVSQPYGLGTAAVLATATTWRWRMRTPSEDQRHTLFWRQLLRQLGEAAQQPRDLRIAVEHDAVQVRLVERDQAFQPRPEVQAFATITGPGAPGDRVTLKPEQAAGAWQARYRAPATGVYRVDVQVDDDAPVTRFVRVGEERPEHFTPVQNQALLRRIAETTGGRYWQPDQAAEVAGTLTFASAGVKRTERLPLWDMPAAFLLLILLKSAEWSLRRRWGQV